MERLTSSAVIFGDPLVGSPAAKTSSGRLVTPIMNRQYFDWHGFLRLILMPIQGLLASRTWLLYPHTSTAQPLGSEPHARVGNARMQPNYWSGPCGILDTSSKTSGEK